jgi:inner membrane protein involved in colicin E2 resistance
MPKNDKKFSKMTVLNLFLLVLLVPLRLIKNGHGKTNQQEKRAGR